MTAYRTRGFSRLGVGVLVGLLLAAARAAAVPVPDVDPSSTVTHMCGDGTTFSVPLPSVDAGIGADDAVTLPHGCRIYALFVSGFGRNPALNDLIFYKVAKYVMEQDGYVHWAWWNNLLAEYLARPLHNDTSWPGTLSVEGFIPDDVLIGGHQKALPDEDVQFQEDARRVLAAIRAHNPGAIIVVAGHSMGGDTVARLGASTNVDIDLLAPIDPVGNRSSPVGYLAPHWSFNWTRWRTTHEFRGWRVADCVRDGGGCKDFDPGWWFRFECQPTGDLLPSPPNPPTLAWPWCDGPYYYFTDRTFGPRVKRLYHRWQKEYLFPFDFGADEYFGHWAPRNEPSGADQLVKSRNIQLPVPQNGLFESDPNKTCNNFLAKDPRDPDRFCNAFDGHGEIIGLRGDPWALDALATEMRGWPGDAEGRRRELIAMAAATPGDGWTRAHQPVNPEMCMVSDDMVEIVSAIVAEQQPAPGDETPPITVGAVDPAPGEHGWHRDSVLVSFEAADDGSGVARLDFVLTGAHTATDAVEAEEAVPAPTTLEASTTLDAEGITSVVYFATDRVGNVESPRGLEVRIDRTAPEVAAAVLPLPNDKGWNATDVTVRFTATDGLSGVATLSSPAVEVTTEGTGQEITVEVTTEGTGQEITATATDRAGNQASATALVSIDKTAPSVAIAAPADGATYLLRASVSAAYSCADTLSGLRTCAGPTPSGAPIDTASPGTKQFTVRAADAAGNLASRTHGYSVQYAFSGFLPPVSAFPALNVAKAGRTVPLKWALRDADGMPVVEPGAVVSLGSAAVACGDVGGPLPALEPASPAGQTSVRIEDGVFLFNWKTSSNWSGCRVLELQLLDGTAHRLAFRFK